MMRGAAARGANLTAQLRAFSRRQRLEPTPVSLNKTVVSMRDLLQSSIGGAIQIETTLQGLHAQPGTGRGRKEALAGTAPRPFAPHERSQPQPVVRTHPETGEKVLFVNAFATHFTNYHTPERVRFGQDANPGAGQLLAYLLSQAYIPEYQVRWRWKKNSIAIWDNRSTQHYAVMDYPPCHRKMERAGIIGDVPF